MLELPYVAGIIDGEGSIGFATCKHRGGVLQLRVRVGMTSLELISTIHQEFGGSVYAAKLLPGRKQMYMWSILQDQAIDFLVKVYPWLLVKKKQATLAMAFYQVKPQKHQVVEIDLFRSQMDKLNGRKA